MSNQPTIFGVFWKKLIKKLYLKFKVVSEKGLPLLKIIFTIPQKLWVQSFWEECFDFWVLIRMVASAKFVQGLRTCLDLTLNFEVPISLKINKDFEKHFRILLAGCYFVFILC